MEKEKDTMYKMIFDMKGLIGEIHSDMKSTLPRVKTLEDQMVTRVNFETEIKAKVGIVAGLVGLVAGNLSTIISFIKGH